MTQMIINNITLPQTSFDKYLCYPVELGENIRMISGRLVSEIRGTYWRIEYTYDKLKDDVMRTLLPVLRSNDTLQVWFLSPDSNEMANGNFKCVEKPAPTFAFAKNGAGLWHNFHFVLEQVVVT